MPGWFLFDAMAKYKIYLNLKIFFLPIRYIENHDHIFCQSEERNDITIKCAEYNDIWSIRTTRVISNNTDTISPSTSKA